MRASTIVAVVVGLLLGAGAAVGGLALGLTRGWLPADWLPAPSAHDEPGHDHPPADYVELSPQAVANLALDVRPVALGPYERTLSVPGQVVDRPGYSAAVVTTPAAGVVTKIEAIPGESAAPGTPLFTLRLVGEELQSGQKDLFKNARELEIVKDERARVEQSVKNGGLPPTRLVELDYQVRRLDAALDAARQDLAARGLSADQIKAAAAGKFLTELTVAAPQPRHDLTVSQSASPPPRFDLDDLKVHPGEKVQAGQALAVLSNHETLDVEGYAFRDEAGLIRRAAVEGWLVGVEFPDEKSAPWRPSGRPPGPGQEPAEPPPVRLTIRSLSNTVEDSSQGFGFRLMLPNEAITYDRDGKTYRVWRFRPGQRVTLKVPVEKYADKIVLPAAAVVREAAEAYVFRQSGDGFQRRPVHVLYEDRSHVVIENDGSVNVGDHVARNGAAQLNRALKAQASGTEEGGEEGHHHHH